MRPFVLFRNIFLVLLKGQMPVGGLQFVPYNDNMPLTKGIENRFASLAKQDPGKARQKSFGKFPQPR